MPRERPLVYMVDDNATDIELVKMGFVELGCESAFDTAKNGEEALRTLKALAADPTAARPDVMILDLNMPRVGGIEVLTYLVSEPRLRSLPVIVLTTSDSPRDRSACLRLGATSYIVKAHNLDDFFTSLKPVVALLRPPPGGGPPESGPGPGPSGSPSPTPTPTPAPVGGTPRSSAPRRSAWVLPGWPVAWCR